MAEVNRQDTLKFTFERSFAKPKSYEFEDWLETVVKVPMDQVIGINFSIVSTVVFLKLKSSDLCEKIIESTGGSLKFNHNDGNVGEVSITHAGFGIRTVRIFELPFEVPADRINDALTPYGKVLSNFAEKWSSARKYPVLNGIRQVKIDLHRHIPSYITVCGHRAIVIYDDQPKTCANCNSTGHVRAQCIQRRVAQIPRGEPAKVSEVTVLPISYAAVTRDQGGDNLLPDVTHLQDDNPIEIETLMETNDEPVPQPRVSHDAGTADAPSATSADITDTQTTVDEVQNREQQRVSEDSESSSQPSSPKRKNKKRRIAHQKAAEAAPQPREESKLIGETLHTNKSGQPLSQNKATTTETGGTEAHSKESQEIIMDGHRGAEKRLLFLKIPLGHRMFS